VRRARGPPPPAARPGRATRRHVGARAGGALPVRAARALLLGAPAGAGRVRPAGGHAGRQPQRVQCGAAARAGGPCGAPAARAAARGQVQRVNALAQPAPRARAHVLRACAARRAPQRRRALPARASCALRGVRGPAPPRAAAQGNLAALCRHTGAAAARRRTGRRAVIAWGVKLSSPTAQVAHCFASGKWPRKCSMQRDGARARTGGMAQVVRGAGPLLRQRRAPAAARA